MPDYGLPPKFRAIAKYIEKNHPENIGKVEPYNHTACDDPDNLTVIPAFPSLIIPPKKKDKRAVSPRTTLAQKYNWTRFGGGR